MASFFCADALDDGDQVKVLRARRSMRVTVTTSPGRACEHPVKLAPNGARARHLLPVDVPAVASSLARLLKLAVEGLSVSREAGIVDEALFGVGSGHILCKP